MIRESPETWICRSLNRAETKQWKRGERASILCAARITQKISGSDGVFVVDFKGNLIVRLPAEKRMNLMNPSRKWRGRLWQAPDFLPEGERWAALALRIGKNNVMRLKAFESSLEKNHYIGLYWRHRSHWIGTCADFENDFVVFAKSLKAVKARLAEHLRETLRRNVFRAVAKRGKDFCFEPITVNGAVAEAPPPVQPRRRSGRRSKKAIR